MSNRIGQGPGPYIAPQAMTPDREAVAMSLQVLQTVPPVAVDGEIIQDDVNALRQSAARCISEFIATNKKDAIFDKAWSKA